MSPNDNPYQILGVPDNASKNEIQQAWRDLVKVWHPDRFAHEPPRLQQKAHHKLQQINAAYEAIQDPSERTRSARHAKGKQSLLTRANLSPVVFYGLAGLLTLVSLRAGLLFRSVGTTLIALMIIVVASALAARAVHSSLHKR